MCLILANLSYEQSDLTPIEKHILLILCLRANTKTKIFWTSIDRLMIDSGYSQNTVEKSMKALRDKNKISNTGVKKGKKRNIPAYIVTIFNHPTARGDKSLTTPPQDDTTPRGGVISGVYHPTTWGTERSFIKDPKKGVFSLRNSTPNPSYQEYCSRLTALKDLNLLDANANILSEDDWLLQNPQN